MRARWVPITVAALTLTASACTKDRPETPASTASSTQTTSATQAPPQTTLAPADREFLTKAAQGGLLEVALGQEAQRYASSPEVKAFGNRMVDDHSAANRELKQIAASKNVAVPDKVNAEQSHDVETFSNLKGAAFDKRYMSTMVDDHTKDVDDFKAAARDVIDADLRGWAARTLPTLQRHLAQAKDIDAKINGSKPKSK